MFHQVANTTDPRHRFAAPEPYLGHLHASGEEQKYLGDRITDGKEILATTQSPFVAQRNDRRTVRRANTNEQRELSNRFGVGAQ